MSVKYCNWCPTPYSPDLKAHPNGTPVHQPKETAMTDLIFLIDEARKALTEAAMETTGTREQIAHYRDLADRLARYEFDGKSVAEVQADIQATGLMFDGAVTRGERFAQLREVLRTELDDDLFDALFGGS